MGKSCWLKCYAAKHDAGTPLYRRFAMYVWNDKVNFFYPSPQQFIQASTRLGLEEMAEDVELCRLLKEAGHDEILLRISAFKRKAARPIRKQRNPRCLSRNAL